MMDAQIERGFEYIGVHAHVYGQIKTEHTLKK